MHTRGRCFPRSPSRTPTISLCGFRLTLKTWTSKRRFEKSPQATGRRWTDGLRAPAFGLWVVGFGRWALGARHPAGGPANSVFRLRRSPEPDARRLPFKLRVGDIDVRDGWR